MQLIFLRNFFPAILLRLKKIWGLNLAESFPLFMTKTSLSEKLQCFTGKAPVPLGLASKKD